MNTLTRKNRLRSAVSVLVFILLFNNGKAQESFVLLELFTSEGCSSCPLADEFLSELIRSDKEGKIFALSYHVDYWNRLGWKDPYSKLQYTVRQENYSRTLTGKEVYTPQLIINGTVAVVGSRREEVRRKIAEAERNSPGNRIALRKDSLVNDTLYFSYELKSASKNYVLRIALTEDGLTNHVLKGENAGKTLSHDAVVRYFTSIDSPAAERQAAVSLKVFTGKGRKQLIVFLQEKKTMRVVGVGRVGV